MGGHMGACMYQRAPENCFCCPQTGRLLDSEVAPNSGLRVNPNPANGPHPAQRLYRSSSAAQKSRHIGPHHKSLQERALEQPLVIPCREPEPTPSSL